METNIEMSIEAYSVVTNQVIALLEAGGIPGQRSSSNRKNSNISLSWNRNRGMNTFRLNMLPYQHQLFLTLKQIKILGGRILNGEKGLYMVYKKTNEKQIYSGGSRVTDRQYYRRYYIVYNIDQCRGLPKVFLPENNEEQYTIDFFGGGVNDNMRLEFTGHDELYYGVLSHELVHITKQERGLYSKEVSEKIIFGCNSYTIEELNAEMTGWRHSKVLLPVKNNVRNTYSKGSRKNDVLFRWYSNFFNL